MISPGIITSLWVPATKWCQDKSEGQERKRRSSSCSSTGADRVCLYILSSLYYLVQCQIVNAKDSAKQTKPCPCTVPQGCNQLPYIFSNKCWIQIKCVFFSSPILLFLKRGGNQHAVDENGEVSVILSRKHCYYCFWLRLTSLPVFYICRQSLITCSFPPCTKDIVLTLFFPRTLLPLLWNKPMQT